MVTSGQENLAFNQSSRSQIKQYRRPFGAEPSARVKPAQQPEAFMLIVEIAVAESALNFAGMFTMRGRSVQVALHTGWIGDGQLRSKMFHDAGRNISGITKKGAQKADGA
jgi:hypothetical protein